MHKAVTKTKFKVTQVSVMLNSVAALHTLDLLHCYWQQCGKVLFVPEGQTCTSL